MGTCKLRAGDRRESVIGYRSPGAKASSGGDGLSNYPAGRPAGRGSRPLRPRGQERPGAALAGGENPSGASVRTVRRRDGTAARPDVRPPARAAEDAPHSRSRAGHTDIENFSLSIIKT